MDPSTIPAPLSINKISTVGDSHASRNPSKPNAYNYKDTPPPASFSAIPRVRRALGNARPAVGERRTRMECARELRVRSTFTAAAMASKKQVGPGGAVPAQEQMNGGGEFPPWRVLRFFWLILVLVR
jgi:hypothetical protein